jgi:ubiquinone/menaquinone biosynthesis C-methylase UbiE
MAKRPPQESHRQVIQESFAKQAEDFSRSPLITDAGFLARLVEWSQLGGTESVLDVACGPGLVVAAFASKVRRAVGIDVTPAMLTRAAVVVRDGGATNACFVLGDVRQLPFPAASFDRVVSRRAFHHFPDPAAVLGEMARVCKPTGAVLIEDQALPTDPVAAETMTTIDRLRDPSHTRAVSPDDWPPLLGGCGLRLDRIEIVDRELEVEEWLPRAHPPPENAAKVRAMIDAATRGETPGLAARYVDGGLRFSLGLQLLRACPAG